jgi:SAM-dependent methyltransferase
LFPSVTEYVGLDIADGPGVDLVAKVPYLWHDQCGGQFDVVISAQVFEHNPLFWLTILNMSLILKPGGVMLIVAPSAGQVHRHPLDCWRFYPDAGAALAAYACCEIIDTGVLKEDFPVKGASNWKDWYCVLKKPDVDSGVNDLMRQILISHSQIAELHVKPVTTVGPLTLHLNSMRKAKTAV